MSLLDVLGKKNGEETETREPRMEQQKGVNKPPIFTSRFTLVTRLCYTNKEVTRVCA